MRTRASTSAPSGLREGPLTGAADSLDVLLSGKGGHTSRPHLTEDLTFALGKLVTELPAVLSRRLDPRAGVSVVWGIVRAGSAVNVIPATGRAGGTVRMLDAVAWVDAEELVRDTIDQIVEPYGVHAAVTYVRGVPPVVNEHRSTVLFGQAVETVLGEEGHVATSQSLGGEDFAWYLESVPGAMAGSARARRAARPTTSTREICAWTSEPSRSAPPCSRLRRSRRWSPTHNTCRDRRTSRRSSLPARIWCPHHVPVSGAPRPRRHLA